MKRFILIILILLPSIIYSQISIYDIQYTTNAGDGTYPSPYAGQVVTTGGIVTANNYSGNRFFISSSIGGAWNGLFVYDNDQYVELGDSVLITGTVFEYNGYTEIKDLTSCVVKSVANSLPQTAIITTAQVYDEAYEGVLVEINNSSVSSTYDAYGNWGVNDGSGECIIRDGIFNLENEGFPLSVGYNFSSIKGIVADYYGISLQLRSIDDVISAADEFILSTEDKIVSTSNEFTYPIKLSILNQTEDITSYSISFTYDQTVFQYSGFDKTGTFSETGSVNEETSGGVITLNYTGSTTCSGIDNIINLKFAAISSGNADFQLQTSSVNGTDLSYYFAGDLQSLFEECNTPQADTLTIVQRPLLNIPSIVVPQQEMDIECFAPESTTDWSVELFYKDITVPVEVNQANYNSSLDKWTLNTTIPAVDLYELYNMRVTASGGLTDDVKNAVKVIDQFKDNYYFIHITDTHLPGHSFYGDPGYENDNSGLDDLQAVIDDINLLNPEFVIHTGDLINEGELEDFECLRHHTLTVQLLEQLEVPVYVVPGNHDLGGWDATPPSQGTARREWWRFFGWRQREIPPTQAEYQSHDYSFDYGDIHFTGLEAYDNYDSYMYDVYGSTSFTSSQLAWLSSDLTAAGDKTKVLFYHYDFKHELDLSGLGVDMALWGHTHSDYNNATHPYSISTASVCDGKRAFRVIRVNNGDLEAESSVRTHSSGDMLTINFNTLNDGSLDLVSATVQNNYGQGFNNGLVRFIMPSSDYGYSVTNGVLEQTLVDGSNVVCYVRVNIPANGSITVTIEKNTSVNIDKNLNAENIEQNYPNPFSDKTQINFQLTNTAKVDITVYDVSGKKIKRLADDILHAGEYTISWDGTNSSGSIVDNGVYFYKFTRNDKIIDIKQMVFIK